MDVHLHICSLNSTSAHFVYVKSTTLSVVIKTEYAGITVYKLVSAKITYLVLENCSLCNMKMFVSIQYLKLETEQQWYSIDMCGNRLIL